MLPHGRAIYFTFFNISFAVNKLLSSSIKEDKGLMLSAAAKPARVIGFISSMLAKPARGEVVKVLWIKLFVLAVFLIVLFQVCYSAKRRG
jgi:hypothetical protein